MRIETLIEDYLTDYGVNSKMVKGYVSEDTLKCYRKNLNMFCRYLKENNLDTGLNQITGKVILSYFNYLVDKENSPATRNLILTTLRSFYNWIKKKYKVDLDPFVDIKPAFVQRRESTYISDEDRMLIHKETDKKCGMNQTIIKLLLQGGLRARELIELDNEDVSFNDTGMVIKVRKGKGGKFRELPFVCVNPEDGSENKENLKLRNLLKHQINKNKVETPEDPALFISNIGTRISYQGLVARFKRFLDKINLGGKGYSLHSCRHTCVRQLQKKNVGIQVIQAFCGHSDPMVTQRVYGSHVTVEDIGKANRF